MRLLLLWAWALLCMFCIPTGTIVYLIVGPGMRLSSQPPSEALSGEPVFRAHTSDRRRYRAIPSSADIAGEDGV